MSELAEAAKDTELSVEEDKGLDHAAEEEQKSLVYRETVIEIEDALHDELKDAAEE
jgi:hypothetical protein